jgi:PAS domain-containing protein
MPGSDVESSPSSLSDAAPPSTLEGPASQLSLVQEAMGIVTWIWDIASDRVDWYGDLSPLLGLPRGAFGGRFPAFLERMHPDDAKASHERLVACLKGILPSYRAEERVVWPGGGWRRTVAARTVPTAGRCAWPAWCTTSPISARRCRSSRPARIASAT